MKQTHPWRYLIQEAALIPLLGYTLLIGATLNGLAMYAVIRISLILLGVVGALWLGWCFCRREPFLPSPLQGPLLGLLAAYGVTTLTSIDPRRSLNALWLMGLCILTFALVSDLLARGWPAELFVKSLLIVGSILIAYGMLQLALWERQWLEISGGTQIVPPVIVRLNPFLTHANMVAVFVNLLLPLALVRLLTSRSTFVRVLLAGYLACAGVVVLFTSSRAGWLGAITALGGTGLLGLGASGWLKKAPLHQWRWNVGTVTMLLVTLIALGIVSAVAVRVVRHPSHGPLFQSRQDFWGPAWRTFADSLLVGSGPDTYATSYMRDNSVPPKPLYVRAHSTILHLASETGLIGLAAGAWIIVALVRATLRRWQMVASTSERFLLSGLIGSLAGCVVHSLFDTPLAVPSIALTLALLLALLVTPTRRPALEGQPHPWWNVGLAVLWLSLMASGVWMQYAYAPFLDGTALANLGDYQAAAPLLEKAVQRDPGHAFYNLQTGYVYGRLAASDNESGRETDETVLDTAIIYYETGVAQEPAYSLNHANLASLYWARGDSDRAIAEMIQASQLAPHEATYPLNLGTFYEQLGREQEAMAAYSTTLSLRPTWANAYFWRSTPLRQEIHAQWRAAQPVNEPLSASEKLVHFERAVQASPASALARVDKAAALIELQRYAEAERELKTALFVGGLEPGALVRARFLLGELAYRTGEVQAAIAHTERALKDIRHQSIFGPGTYGTSLYGWAIFYRVGLVADMLPQLMTITYTDEIVDYLIKLGEWYEQVSDVASAKRIYSEVLAAAPDAVSARQRLSVLETVEMP